MPTRFVQSDAVARLTCLPPCECQPLKLWAKLARSYSLTQMSPDVHFVHSRSAQILTSSAPGQSGIAQDRVSLAADETTCHVELRLLTDGERFKFIKLLVTAWS